MRIRASYSRRGLNDPHSAQPVRLFVHKSGFLTEVPSPSGLGNYLKGKQNDEFTHPLALIAVILSSTQRCAQETRLQACHRPSRELCA